MTAVINNVFPLTNHSPDLWGRNLKWEGGGGGEAYRPYVGGDEDDDGEGGEPGVADGEEDVTRDVGAGEVLEGDGHHAQGEGQGDEIEHPHRSPPTNNKGIKTRQRWSWFPIMIRSCDSDDGACGGTTQSEVEVVQVPGPPDRLLYSFSDIPIPCRPLLSSPFFSFFYIFIFLLLKYLFY